MQSIRTINGQEAEEKATVKDGLLKEHNHLK